MQIEEQIFKRSYPSIDKLIAYGFIKQAENYVYTENFFDDTFKIEITITSTNQVKGRIYDLELDDEYLAYRIEHPKGEFVNKIKDYFEQKLLDVKKKCFIDNNFIYPQANRISNQIKEKYDIEPEFLWKDDNKNAVFRNLSNKKWIGIIMNINKNKLTAEEKDIEAINVKLDDTKIPELIEREGIYKAYHMNKKYWVTISLDDTLSDEEIMQYIEESYSYTVTTNEWVVPANPKYYDVVNCFNNTKRVTWKQSSSIHEGDTVYLYVGAPYSCIMFKCKALKTNIPYSYSNSNLTISNTMDLELVKAYPHDKYTFKEVSKYDLKAIRGPRRMPKKLLDYMKKEND